MASRYAAYNLPTTTVLGGGNSGDVPAEPPRSGVETGENRSDWRGSGCCRWPSMPRVWRGLGGGKLAIHSIASSRNSLALSSRFDRVPSSSKTFRESRRPRAALLIARCRSCRPSIGFPNQRRSGRMTSAFRKLGRRVFVLGIRRDEGVDPTSRHRRTAARAPLVSRSPHVRLYLAASSSDRR